MRLITVVCWWSARSCDMQSSTVKAIKTRHRKLFSIFIKEQIGMSLHKYLHLLHVGNFCVYDTRKMRPAEIIAHVSWWTILMYDVFRCIWLIKSTIHLIFKKFEIFFSWHWNKRIKKMFPTKFFWALEFISTKSSFYIHQKLLWLYHLPYTRTTDKNCRRQFLVLRISSPSIVCVSQQVSSIFQATINWLAIRQKIVSCHLNLFGVTHETENSTENEDGKNEWFFETDLSDPVSWALLCGAAQWGGKLWKWCKCQRKVQRKINSWNNYWICSQYDQEIAGWIPVPAAYMAPSMYPYHAFQRYPGYNERVKTWAAAPIKRNSELINSLLGLPKNMDAAGKWEIWLYPDTLRW